MDHGMHKKIFQSGRRGKAWSRFWQATAPKRKAALIIGLNFTDHMDLEPDQTHSRDVETMAKLLKSVYDFDSTVVLSDKEGTPEELIPTQSNIMRELATFIPSNPRSDYFFVFQGHSSRGVIEEIGTDEEYREAEYIIPSDGIDPQTNMVDLDRVITDQTLYNLLVADLPEDSQLIALFDSCNAGTLLDLQYPKSNRVQEDPNDPNSLSSFFRRIKNSIMNKKRSSSLMREQEIISKTPRDQWLHLERHRCNRVETSASWFGRSRRFTVSGGHFYSSTGPMTINQVPHNHQGLDTSSSPLLELDLLYPKDIHLQKEIHKGPGYRLHSGENKGKAVVVKVFEGRHAKKISVETANFNKQVMHPCFLQIIAAASGNSDLSFLVFSGGTVESIMRVTLLQNLEKSFVLGLQTIVALSSGLDYLQDVNYPVLETEARAFVLLLTHLDNVVISFDPNVSNLCPRRKQIHLDVHARLLKAKRPEHSKSILDLFSDILQKTFYLPCEEYYRLVQDPTPEERRSLTPLEPSDAQMLASSTNNDPPRRRTAHDGRLSLERISHGTEAILKSFLLDPSLDRHHGRSTEALKNKLSGCCSRTLSQGSHCDCRWKDKPGCITKSTFSTLRKGCSSSSRYPDHSYQGEDTALREICCSPSVDATPCQETCSPSPSTEPSLVTLAASESSNPRGRTMIEGVAEFLRKDPSPKYRQIMQIAMTHVWMSERDNVTPTLC